MPTQLFASSQTLESSTELTEFARDVRTGLTCTRQKSLPAKYLYDPLGSALFEAITLLPEYGLTRADERLLCRSASEISQQLCPRDQVNDQLVVELGCGSGRKARTILTALLNTGQAVRYMPVDVAAEALFRCAQDLGSLCEINPIEEEFLEGLQIAAGRRMPGERLLVLFLGSTIGNFEPAQAIHFLSSLRGLLMPGDALLVGTDLLKSAEILIPAYDDALGITAAFDLNVLVRMNRELGAQFDLQDFRHRAVLNPTASRVEMHLVAQRNHKVDIPGAGFVADFRRDETIHTESSHKYTEASVLELATQTGWKQLKSWKSADWALTENLWLVS